MKLTETERLPLFRFDFRSRLASASSSSASFPNPYRTTAFDRRRRKTETVIRNTTKINRSNLFGPKLFSRL